MLAVEVGLLVPGFGEAIAEQQVGVEREAKAEKGVLQEVSVVEAEIGAVSRGTFVVVGKADCIQHQDLAPLDQTPPVGVVGASEVHGKDTSGEREPVLPEDVQRLATATVHRVAVEWFAGEEIAGDNNDRLRKGPQA